MVDILARILDSERNFNGSADPMTTADRGFIKFLARILDFGCWEVRIVDLNVSPEISLSLFRPFMCQMSRSIENDLKYFSNALLKSVTGL